MNCPYCGNPLEGNETFCTMCGQQLPQNNHQTQWVNPAPPAPQSQPQQKGGKKKATTIILAIIAGVLVVSLTTTCLLAMFDIGPFEDNPATSSQSSSVAESSQTAASQTSVVQQPNAQAVVSQEPQQEYQLSAFKYTATASSYLKEPKNNLYHSPDRVLDDDPATAWVEGASGYGIGESITIHISDTVPLHQISIWAGYHKSGDLYYKNSRPKEIQVRLSNGYTQTFTLSDVCAKQVLTLTGEQYTNYMEFTIVSVYPGSKYQDTAITDIWPY